MLMLDLRPMTAKWHRAYSEGRLNSRDGANEFREDLEAVQAKLRDFADELHQMAYGRRARVGCADAGGALGTRSLRSVLVHLPFGIPRTSR